MTTTALIKSLRESTGAGLLDCQKALQAHAGDVEKAAAYLREKGLAKAAKKADRETGAGLVIVKSAGPRVCAVEVDCETDFVARTDNFRAFVQRLADQVLADASLVDAAQVLAATHSDYPGQTTADTVQDLIAKLGENIVVRRVARYAASETSLVEGYIHAGELAGAYGPMEGRVGVLVELDAGSALPAAREALQDLTHALALHIAAAGPRYLSPEEIPSDVLQNQRDRLMVSLAVENKSDSLKLEIVEGALAKFRQEICLLTQAFVKDDSRTIDQLLRQKGQALGGPISVKRFARFEVEA
jgi:elongation factor Ts